MLGLQMKYHDVATVQLLVEWSYFFFRELGSS
jgi:hypothetical protein